MTQRQRIYAAIKGEPVDRVPFSLWRHFPDVDQTARGLAEAVIGFQKKFEFDLVKITPASGYFPEAWGAKLIYRTDEEGKQKGTREFVSYPVKTPKDWQKLQSLDVTRGILGRELKAIKFIRQGLREEIPIVQTIPNPLTTAKSLIGNRWLEHLRKNPTDLKVGLSIIVETTLKFAQACLQAGADGIFFFTQLARHDFLTEEEYRLFGVEYDRQVLEALKEQTDLLILHIHGLNIMFDLLKDYPVQILNWHDRRTQPSLMKAQKRFKGTVLGGLNEQGVLVEKGPEEVKEQVKDALKQTNSQRVIIGPGCVISIRTPEANIRAIKEVL